MQTVIYELLLIGILLKLARHYPGLFILHILVPFTGKVYYFEQCIPEPKIFEQVFDIRPCIRNIFYQRVIAIIEQFSAGLGTAAFLAFLMTLCSRRHAATQFALLSALYRVAGLGAAAVSGFLTQRFGYADYFLLTFCLALPGFVLLPLVRRALAAQPAEPEPAA